MKEWLNNPVLISIAATCPTTSLNVTSHNVLCSDSVDLSKEPNMLTGFTHRLVISRVNEKSIVAEITSTFLSSGN
jgi:hypothetical protein